MTLSLAEIDSTPTALPPTRTVLSLISGGRGAGDVSGNGRVSR